MADVIASSSRAANRLAQQQMSGAFSCKLNELRERLVKLASLLELELDFSEEDVEFADRESLAGLADEIIDFIEKLTATYTAGRAIKEGIPVAIAGAPNAGKSTLLNRLLNDDKAIVSDIPGTTRDVIEDSREIDGILFRFRDTAGLRDTDDPVESIGIARAHEAIEHAAIILWVYDMTGPDDQIDTIIAGINARQHARHIILLNKADTIRPIASESVDRPETVGVSEIATGQSDVTEESGVACESEFTGKSGVADVLKVADQSGVVCQSIIAALSENAGVSDILPLSAKTGAGIQALERILIETAHTEYNPDSELILTNARHKAALTDGLQAMRRARSGISGALSADFIAQDIREALHHIGLVTGSITTDTLLQTIFHSFCIGK